MSDVTSHYSDSFRSARVHAQLGVPTKKGKLSHFETYMKLRES